MSAPTIIRAHVDVDTDAVDAVLAHNDSDHPTTDAVDCDRDAGGVDGNWGRSVFDAIDTAFAQMSDDVDPVGINCAPWADLGLPGRFLTLRELRDWLGTHRTAYPARAAVWQDLVRRARARQDWVTAAAGMALPALVSVAGRISRGYIGDPGDIDAEILTTFLEALRTVDVDDPRLFSRLRWTATRAGIAVRWDQAPCILVGDIENAVGMAPHLPYGHPDLIVARAVGAQVLHAADAELILTTRLEGTTIETLAAAAGVDAAVLRMRRNRAETALVEAVTTGLLSGSISAERRRNLAMRASARTARRGPQSA